MHVFDSGAIFVAKFNVFFMQKEMFKLLVGSRMVTSSHSGEGEFLQFELL